MTRAEPSLAAQVERAMGLIRCGDHAGADAVLEAILQRKPSHPDALQLRGYVRQLSGRWDAAIELYRASLKAKNNQPPVHNNLGLALAATGQKEEAEKCYRRAIVLAPSHVGAACSLAALLIETGRLDEAEGVLVDATKLNPSAARAFELTGIVLVQKGRATDALSFAERAAALAPASHSAHYNLGLALIAAGDFDRACRSLREAVGLAPASDAAWTSLGYATALANHANDAIGALQRAVAINPSNAHAHRLLNDQLWQSGAPGHLRSYKAAIASRPADARLRLDYANRLLQFQEHEGARAELSEAARIAPEDAHIRDALARAAAAAGDFEQALAHHRRALDQAPEEAVLARHYMETLLRCGEASAAIDAGRSALARSPHDQGLLAYYSAALRLCSDPEHAAISDYAALPITVQIEPPNGFSDIETFNMELAARLRALHTMRQNPLEQTVRGGTQTAGSLFGRGDPIILLLEQQLGKAVARYIRGMPDAPSHPFLGRKSGAFAFSGSWSVCLKSNGFHTNHFHPGGWISSAYYVEVPAETGEVRDRQGWLKMGETHLALRDEAIQRLERPCSGRLVLFPSYFWHGTVPFEGGGDRLTVAFDVVPA